MDGGPKKKARAPAKKPRSKKSATSTVAPAAQAVLDVTAIDDTNAPTIVPSAPSDDENVVVRLCVDGSDDSSDDLLGAALSSTDAASILHSADAYAPMAYNFDEELYCETGRGRSHRNVDVPSSFVDRQKTVEVLSDFAEKSRAGEWPQDTSVACHWCCHAFSSQPVGLPVSHANGRFVVVGVFCSLECACAHNFRTSDHMDEMWERNALINMMARQGGRDWKEGPVKPAPDRLALRTFGGHMSIDEFRAFAASSDKTLFVNVPPIMSATTLQLEEISDADLACHRHRRHRHPADEAEAATTTKYVPLDHGRIDRYNSEMRIRRSKPISGPSGTSLEATMNVRFLDTARDGPGRPHPGEGARAGAP